MLRNEIELDWVIRNGGGGHEEQQEDEGGGLTKNTGSNTGHVFVCTPASLDTGLSRELLLRFAEREDSVFFFLTEPWRGPFLRPSCCFIRLISHSAPALSSSLSLALSSSLCSSTAEWSEERGGTLPGRSHPGRAKGRLVVLFARHGPVAFSFPWESLFLCAGTKFCPCCVQGVRGSGMSVRLLHLSGFLPHPRPVQTNESSRGIEATHLAL